MTREEIQEEALKATEGKRRSTVVLGTGVGKTLVGLTHIERNSNDRFDDAVTIFRQICLDEDHFPTFLTLSAYSQFLVGAAANK